MYESYTAAVIYLVLHRIQHINTWRQLRGILLSIHSANISVKRRNIYLEIKSRCLTVQTLSVRRIHICAITLFVESCLQSGLLPKLLAAADEVILEWQRSLRWATGWV